MPHEKPKHIDHEAVRHSPCAPHFCCTVMSEIQVGELLCDSLANAEDAPALSFILLDGERVVAEQTSYTVTGGDPFSDEIGRQVCLQ